MVTARVVEHDPETRTYSLPREHAAWLTRAAGINNIAVQTQYIPLLAEVEQKIVECFRKGGGVPYSEYPRFQRLMAEDSANVHDATLLNAIIPLVPALTQRLRDGIDVADVGCGSGRAINLMAKAFPNSRFSGFDFSNQGIAQARAEAGALGVSNATFEVRDVTNLGITDAFDLVTAFDAIHDQAKPASVLRGIAEALREDGVFLMVDIAASSHVHENMDHPLGTFLYTVSTMHCMTVSLTLNGEGLGTMWGEQKAREMLAEAGFGQIDVARVEGDIFNVYYVARKRGAG